MKCKHKQLSEILLVKRFSFLAKKFFFFDKQPLMAKSGVKHNCNRKK